MSDDIREINPEDIKLLDYMLVPIKEYRQLITEKAKLEQQVLEYFKQAELYRDLVADYKHETYQLLGIKDLKQAKKEQEDKYGNTI